MPGTLSRILLKIKGGSKQPSQPQVTTPQPKMASTTASASNADSLLSAIKVRRTNYALTDKSTISDARVEEIVKEALTHVPSAFNVQSARAVVLFGDNHRKLWQLGFKHMKAIMPPETFVHFEGKIKGLEAAHGTVMFFEDQEVLEALSAKNPMVKSEVPDWSSNSAGMHQFTVWTALSLEGLGASLQHYNMVPPFAKEVTETWSLPESWKLGAQLVFGTPSAPAGERKYSPIEPRIKVFA